MTIIDFARALRDGWHEFRCSLRRRIVLRSERLARERDLPLGW